MAAGPAALEEIDVEKHTARQISTLVGRELGLSEPESLTPAQVVVQGKERVLRHFLREKRLMVVAPAVARC